MEQQTPIPPKSRMKPREGQKCAIFSSLIYWGRGGGLGFPFILSKIVVFLAAWVRGVGLAVLGDSGPSGYEEEKHKPDLQQTKDTGFQRPVTDISSEEHTSTVVYSTLICGQCTPFLSGHQLGPTIFLLTFSLLPRQISRILQYYSL